MSVVDIQTNVFKGITTRCAWCRHLGRPRDPVSCRVEPYDDGSRFHRDCADVADAHHTCTCHLPQFRWDDARCCVCGQPRPTNYRTEDLARWRLLKRIPPGHRNRIWVRLVHNGEVSIGG